jgi:diaminohydroxyphosphoribosylaminopyrimidine deaminase/5-amino-6-(5-phosphoribosylamino)uracil reductase
MSLDGKIATKIGESKWITGETSRKFVQHLRYGVDAVLVGVNTVKKDNPALTCRLPGQKKDLYKIILGSRKSMPRGTVLLNDPKALFIENSADLKRLAGKLYRDDRICSVLVEGGGTVNDSFIRSGLIDEFYLFVAPKIIGGENAVAVVGGKGFARLSQARKIAFWDTAACGEDLLIHGIF